MLIPLSLTNCVGNIYILEELLIINNSLVCARLFLQTQHMSSLKCTTALHYCPYLTDEDTVRCEMLSSLWVHTVNKWLRWSLIEELFPRHRGHLPSERSIQLEVCLSAWIGTSYFLIWHIPGRKGASLKLTNNFHSKTLKCPKNPLLKIQDSLNFSLTYEFVH